MFYIDSIGMTSIYIASHIQVDGMITHSTADLGLATIVRSSKNLQFISPHLVVKSWWNSVEVCIPESLTNALCGICGDFSQNEEKASDVSDSSSLDDSARKHWAKFDMDTAR